MDNYYLLSSKVVCLLLLLSFYKMLLLFYECAEYDLYWVLYIANYSVKDEGWDNLGLLPVICLWDIASFSTVLRLLCIYQQECSFQPCIWIRPYSLFETRCLPYHITKNSILSETLSSQSVLLVEFFTSKLVSGHFWVPWQSYFKNVLPRLIL